MPEVVRRKVIRWRASWQHIKLFISVLFPFSSNNIVNLRPTVSVGFTCKIFFLLLSHEEKEDFFGDPRENRSVCAVAIPFVYSCSTYMTTPTHPLLTIQIYIHICVCKLNLRFPLWLVMRLYKAAHWRPPWKTSGAGGIDISLLLLPPPPPLPVHMSTTDYAVYSCWRDV